jgi:phosphoglycolate phosphatase-like HAD superfamily hydrolase
MCGDDPLPQKPDGAVLERIASELDIQPQEMLMVGDTIIDMLTGRNGGAAGCVAIYPNHTAGSSPFDEVADVVLPSISGLQVC